MRGTLVVYFNKSIVDGMTLIPKKQLSEAEVIRVLGPSPLCVHYATADCLTEGGSAPICESPDGPTVHLEYRSRATAVILDHGQVEAVAFVRKPIRVNTEKPWGVESVEGVTQFDVLPESLVEW